MGLFSIENNKGEENKKETYKQEKKKAGDNIVRLQQQGRSSVMIIHHAHRQYSSNVPRDVHTTPIASYWLHVPYTPRPHPSLYFSITSLSSSSFIGFCRAASIGKRTMRMLHLSVCPSVCLSHQNEQFDLLSNSRHSCRLAAYHVKHVHERVYTYTDLPFIYILSLCTHACMRPYEIVFKLHLG